MKRNHLSVPLAVGLVAGIVSAASAVVFPGGGPKKSDCYVGAEVDGMSHALESASSPVRADMKACSSSCTFSVKECINESASVGSVCTPQSVTAVTIKPAGVISPPPTGGSTPVCGATATVTVPLKGKKQNHPGKAAFRIVATSSGKPKKDADKLVLRCLPNPASDGCGVSIGPTCPKNPQGGPDEVVLTVADKCTDLDNGWTGTSHNFPVTPGSQLFMCISGCDDSTNPNCTATGPIGAGSLNGVTFGPPLPLLAAQVPVCVLNRFQTPPTATGNIQTGTMDLQVKLFSDVFLTSVGLVCPRCKNAKCDSGPKMGQACKVDGTVTVAQAAGDKVYPVSRDCPTDAAHSQFAGTLSITLPLTTGTSSLQGARPCRAQPGDPSTGIPVQDDQCGAGVCNSVCTGLACVSHATDCPGSPCLDSKGGLSQFCCSNDSTKPCYPTGNPAVAKIERTGIPMPPTPVWPDPTYPKNGTGTVVSVFCEPATTANTINTTAGLPGPGALILPGSNVWMKLP